jgi:hypothetical protein
MAFTNIQISFLQRLVRERRPTRQASAAARYFCENFSLGRLVRSQVDYNDAHFAAAERLLVANHLPVKALGAGTTRAEAAEYGGMSEKSFSAAPHANSVAVKNLGRCELDGHGMYTPEGAYVVLTVEQAMRATCQRIMVVENLETFRALQAYSWMDCRGLAMLAIYRGEKDLPNKDAAEVVHSRSEPIWGFFDFDPAGLVMASALPAHRLERLVLPDWTWLERAADIPRGRQLFDGQVSSYASVLDGVVHPEVAAAWGLMKRLRSGVAQERMLTANQYSAPKDRDGFACEL